MEASIIFKTYRPGGIDILADSLQNQTFKDYELIVIDDYAIDRREAVRSYLEERGIPVAYVGPSKPKCFPELTANIINTNNTGFLLSTKDVVIGLDDYIWLPPDWLERLSRNADLLKRNYCIVHGGQMWHNQRQRDNQGIISIWEQPWKGSPEENECWKFLFWMPEGLEITCYACSWNLLAAMNGLAECLDAYISHPLEPIIEKIKIANGKVYVDRENIIHMIDHRVWPPAELWHHAKRKPTGSTTYIERENCFDLKKHVRGKAYWLED